jgi:hypothetical protein
MAEENQHKILVTSDNDEKKIIRREVEKQRRMQMSILCSSLRSSLPLELIKVFNLFFIFCFFGREFILFLYYTFPLINYHINMLNFFFK